MPEAEEGSAPPPTEEDASAEEPVEETTQTFAKPVPQEVIDNLASGCLNAFVPELSRAQEQFQELLHNEHLLLQTMHETTDSFAERPEVEEIVAVRDVHPSVVLSVYLCLRLHGVHACVRTRMRVRASPCVCVHAPVCVCER